MSYNYYDAACDINNRFELGLSDTKLEWVTRRIARAATAAEEWAYNAAYNINNGLEIGLSAADINWMARKILRARATEEKP